MRLPLVPTGLPTLRKGCEWIMPDTIAPGMKGLRSGCNKENDTLKNHPAHSNKKNVLASGLAKTARPCHDGAELSLTVATKRVMEQQPPTLRKLSHEQARTEEHLYWSRKSIPERLAAATALTQRLYRMRGIDIDEQQADFTPRRVPRRKG